MFNDKMTQLQQFITLSCILVLSCCTVSVEEKTERSKPEKLFTLEGTLCYPSEYIPERNIYLKNIDTDSIYRFENQVNENKFRFENIPSGKYVAYAYTKELLEKRYNEPKYYKASGGYTKMVPCGLSVECTDHSLITIDVENGKPIKDILICDWYGAIVPDER